jgi:hypothetical protein
MDLFSRTKLWLSRCLPPFPERSIALVKRLAGSPKGAEIDPNLPHANKSVTKVAHAFLYTLMDFFQSHQTVPKLLLSYLFHFPERSIALVKRLAGSPKELKLIPTCPITKVLLQGSTRILIYIDESLQSHQTVKPLLSYLLPYSRTFNCTSKTTGWFKKELKLIPTCPTLTKVLLKVAHAFLYTLMDSFSRTKLCPSRCYLTFFLPERSIALVKRLAGSPKGAEIDPNLPHANKSVTQGSTRILIYIDGLSFSRTKLCPSCCYLTFFHFPERSIVKRLAGSPKGAEIDPNLPHANKVFKVAHAFLYTLMDFFQSHQTVPKPLLSYLLPFS